MNAAEVQLDSEWQTLCDASELMPNLGVRALVDGQQIAVFKVQDQLYALSAIDPFTQTAVLSRGIVGDLNGHVVVTSPIYKQHFDLRTGQCLEDDSVRVATYPVREWQGSIQVSMTSLTHPSP